MRPRPFRIACALALVLAAATACSERDGARRPALADIVLVSVDSLRADRLGCYGADRPTSPSLDQLAAEGVRFETVIAPTSWTLPSHVTLLTGMSIPVHGVAEREDRIDPRRRLLAEHLAEHGYRTAGFVSAPYLHRAYGFDRGFEVYENFGAAEQIGAVEAVRDAHAPSHDDETGARVIDAALRWLDARPVGAGPIFLFVHLWDVHYDYVPPPPYDGMFSGEIESDLDVRNFEKNPAIEPDMPKRDLAYLKALYDAEIRWMDSQLLRLVEALRARGSLDRTLLSVSADHGEEFFEHGQKGHHKNLWEESIRVPWVLRYPPGAPAGRTVGGVASLEDVAPTLLALAGLPSLAGATGNSLAAAMRGGPAPERPVLLTLHELTGLRGVSWKVLLDRRRGRSIDLDLAEDPGEQRPRAAPHAAPERLAALDARLAQAHTRARALGFSEQKRVELDATTLARLRQLGYIE